MVLIGQSLYEVSDATHPKLLCTISNTSAHLYTADTFTYIRWSGEGTEVVLHSIGSGNESVISGFTLALLRPSWGGFGAFSPDGTVAANAVAGTDGSGNQTIQIWLFSGRSVGELYEFLQPLTDCICRFGIPPPVLAFSADGQYLVSGWPVGKGATPFAVYRVADRVRVASFDPSTSFAAWDWTGHHLYVSGMAGSQSWTPETGAVVLKSATQWPYDAGTSPDGAGVAYTAYVDPADPKTLRVYAYDFAGASSRLLVNRLRSEVVFVKPGWVWYLEEAACDPAAPNCAPWGTAPTGRVFAMDLKVGAETPVVFASPQTTSSPNFDWGPGEFWPKS